MIISNGVFYSKKGGLKCFFVAVVMMLFYDFLFEAFVWFGGAFVFFRLKGFCGGLRHFMVGRF